MFDSERETKRKSEIKRDWYRNRITNPGREKKKRYWWKKKNTKEKNERKQKQEKTLKKRRKIEIFRKAKWKSLDEKQWQTGDILEKEKRST